MTTNKFHPTPQMWGALMDAFEIFRHDHFHDFKFALLNSDHTLDRVGEWALALVKRNVSLEAIVPAAREWVASNKKKPTAAAFAELAEEVDIREYRYKGRLDLLVPAEPALTPALRIVSETDEERRRGLQARLEKRFGKGNYLARYRFFEVCLENASSPAEEAAIRNGIVSDALYEKGARWAGYDYAIAARLGGWAYVPAFWRSWLETADESEQLAISQRLVSQEQLDTAIARFLADREPTAAAV